MDQFYFGWVELILINLMLLKFNGFKSRVMGLQIHGIYLACFLTGIFVQDFLGHQEPTRFISASI